MSGFVEVEVESEMGVGDEPTSTVWENCTPSKYHNHAPYVIKWEKRT